MHRQLTTPAVLMGIAIPIAVLVGGFILLVRRTLTFPGARGGAPDRWMPRAQVFIGHGLWTWFVVDVFVRTSLPSHEFGALHLLVSIPVVLLIAGLWARLRARNAVILPKALDPSLVDLDGLTQELKDRLSRTVWEQRMPPLPLWIDLCFALGCLVVGFIAAIGLHIAVDGSHAAAVTAAATKLRDVQTSVFWAAVRWIVIAVVTYFVFQLGSPEKVPVPAFNVGPELATRLRSTIAGAVRIRYLSAAGMVVFFAGMNFESRFRHYLVLVHMLPALLFGVPIGYLWSRPQARRATALLDSLPPRPQPGDEAESGRSMDAVTERRTIPPLPVALNAAILVGCVAVGEAVALLVRSTWHIWGAVHTEGNPHIAAAAALSVAGAAAVHVLLRLHRSTEYSAGESGIGHSIIGCWLCHRYGIVSGLAAVVPSAIILSPGSMVSDPLILAAAIFGWHTGKTWCDRRLRRAGIELGRPVKLTAATNPMDSQAVAAMPAWTDALVIVACTALGVLVALGIRVLLARYGILYGRANR